MEASSTPKLPKGFFSNSQYNSWLICGKAYEFKYVQQISTPDYASTSRATQYTLEPSSCSERRWPRSLRLSRKGLEVVSTTFDEKAKGVLDWGDQEPGKVKDLAIRLFKTYTTYGLPKINPVGIEEGFAKKAATFRWSDGSTSSTNSPSSRFRECPRKTWRWPRRGW
jgi:hypothetical protein